jgi:hypothetical protein
MVTSVVGISATGMPNISAGNDKVQVQSLSATQDRHHAVVIAVVVATAATIAHAFSLGKPKPLRNRS